MFYYVKPALRSLHALAMRPEVEIWQTAGGEEAEAGLRPWLDLLHDHRETAAAALARARLRG